MASITIVGLSNRISNNSERLTKILVNSTKQLSNMLGYKE